MKLIYGLIAFLTLSFNSSFAQANKDVSTEKIAVNGTCGQCKKRIEDAAYINGVKRAEWDKTSKELTVTYRTSKTSAHKIAESVAKAGHDAGDVKATDSAYGKLPECCAYKHEHAADH